MDEATIIALGRAIRSAAQEDKRADRRDLAKQIHESVMDYGRLLANDKPADDEALAIHLALQGLKKIVSSWEPKK